MSAAVATLATSASSTASSTPAPNSSVGCPVAAPLLLAATYRKKNLSKQLPKELYLRTDLPCHTLLCGRPSCVALGSAASQALNGGAAPAAGVLDPSADHYVVPSFVALQRFHSFFARAHQLHLILLRTHASQANASLTHHLRDLLSNGASRRRAILMENESHAEMATLQRRAEHESNEARHERAVRRAARWYARHLQGAKPIVLLEAEPAPLEESLQLQESGTSAVSAGQSTDAAAYPRQLAPGVTVHSMQSYLAWLLERESQPPPSSGDVPPVSELVQLYTGLVAAEVAKVEAKRQRADTKGMLENMLASVKRELGMDTAGEDAAAAAAAASSSSAAARSASGGANSSSDPEFDEHLPLPLALEGVRRGLLLRGHIHVNKYHALVDATVDLGGRALDATTGKLVESGSSGGGTVGEIFISGSADRNRAIEGDEVIVHMLPPSLWRAPTARKKIAVKVAAPGAGGDGAASTGAEGDDEEDSAASASSSSSSDPSLRPVPTGRIVAIVQRNTRPYVCTLALEDVGRSLSGHDHALVVPMDERIPKIRIKTFQSHLLGDQRLLVAVDSWDTHSKYPAGVYMRSLGHITSLETGVRALLHELDISHPPWSVNQLACLPSRQIDEDAARDSKFKVGSGFHARAESETPFAWSVPPAALQGRLDLRETHRGCVCSIDPIGCEDIDDALSVLQLPNGNVQVGVHIADVSYFVPAGSVLDQEAGRRGTSVYLTDRRLDMLPSTLSADLCSLRGGVDRLALSVLWEFEKPSSSPSSSSSSSSSPAAPLKVVSTWYGRTIIHNSFALSYEEAQHIFDTRGAPPGKFTLPKLDSAHPNARLSVREIYDRAPESSLTAQEREALFPNISTLLLFARQLRLDRLARGALELHSLEVSFVLDSSTKEVTGVRTEADLEVHSTIAEWMVLANSTVAHATWSRFPDRALLRHHPFPAPQRFERLRELAQSMGVEVDTRSNATLAHSLLRAEEVLSQREFPVLDAQDEGGSDTRVLPPLDAQQHRSWLLKLLKEHAARAMSEAQYFSTGSVGEVGAANFYHYGLAANYYTHYTSPIRRYADLIVHRQLLQVIEAERREFHAAKAARKAEAKASSASVTALLSHTSLHPPPVGSFAPSLTHSGMSTSTLLTSSSLLPGNDLLSDICRHLNAKNRNAKYAGSASQELFLACYLAGVTTATRRRGGKEDEEKEADADWQRSMVPRPLANVPPPRPRVERCEALIVSLRANGFIVLLPAYHVKGALPLVDRDGKALLAHPLALAFPPAEDATATASSSSSYAAPTARLVLDEGSQTLSVSLSAPPSAPVGAPASLPQQALPLSRRFRVFEPVLVDVSLRPQQSRYRTPKPVFTLVWQPEGKQQRAGGKMKQHTAAARSNANTAAAAAASSTDPAASAPASGSLLSAPAAPLGAKKPPSSSSRAPPAVPGAANLASSPLYALLRDAATTTRRSKPHTLKAGQAAGGGGEGEDDGDDSHQYDSATIAMQQRHAQKKAAQERHPFSRSAPRLRYRVSGARGGRVLHTPSGLVPAELTKLHIVKQQAAAAAADRGGAGKGDDEEEEDEY